MELDSAVARRPRSPFPAWFGVPMIAYIAFSWWQVGKSQITALPAAGIAPGTGATLALMARVVGWLLESGYYVLWWRWRGRRLSFVWYAQWTAAISIVDLLAEALRRDVGAAPWRTWRTGTSVTPGADPDAWGMVFAGVGLLTLVRLAMSIRVQREALAPIGWGPGFIVLGTWLAGRVAAAWTHDLLSGARLPQG